MNDESGRRKTPLRIRLSPANQAYRFLITGPRAGFDVLLLAFVRQCRGCSERRVPSAAFTCGCSVETQYDAPATLIRRPGSSSTMYCITAFEPHRAHLPCSLSVATRKQSRHSNASGGCSVGLINVSAISTSCGSVTNSWKAFSWLQRIPIYFRGLGAYELNKPKVNGFTMKANCLFLQCES